MTGIEPRISGVGSDRFSNCVKLQLPTASLFKTSTHTVVALKEGHLCSWTFTQTNSMDVSNMHSHLTRPKARFKPTLPKKSEVYGILIRCQHILVCRFTSITHGDLVLLLSPPIIAKSLSSLDVDAKRVLQWNEWVSRRARVLNILQRNIIGIFVSRNAATKSSEISDLVDLSWNLAKKELFCLKSPTFVVDLWEARDVSSRIWDALSGFYISCWYTWSVWPDWAIFNVLMTNFLTKVAQLW